MSCLEGDSDVGNAVCTFIDKGFKIRSDILCHNKWVSNSGFTATPQVSFYASLSATKHRFLPQ